MDKPLYRSFRASFSRDIYMPVCGAVAAPVVIGEIRCGEDLRALGGEKPVQSAILHINRDLAVEDENGSPIASLYEALALCARSVPVLFLEDEDTACALAEFAEYHHLADAILCAKYAKRQVLSYAYEKMPLLRGMLDLRGEKMDIAKIPACAVAHGATSVIIDADAIDCDAVDSLQRRFIHVIAGEGDDFAQSAVKGVNGILTSDPDAAYSFLARFPEGSYLRRAKLFAHKGFSNNGMYSENTITSVVAAAENHFDGAEIDVKLTADDVPVVMHNVNTVGLFDCEKMITEETDYAALASLRRIGFPEESVDRFEDLMRAMAEHTETPVLIELKPGAKYHNVEEMVRLVDGILLRPESQKNCICIMGEIDPGHAYVHRHLPYLPISYCEGAGAMPPPPKDRAEAEECLWRIARLTKGCAAGYNGEDTGMNRLLNEYAKFRMLTVFPWSRSWTLEPSKWEENGPGNCKTYLSGYDAWTTDHGEKFLPLPVRLTPLAHRSADGRPLGEAVFRDGHRQNVECDLLVLGGDVQKSDDGTCRGKGRVLFSLKTELYFGESCRIYSAPVDIDWP